MSRILRATAGVIASQAATSGPWLELLFDSQSLTNTGSGGSTITPTGTATYSANGGGYAADFAAGSFNKLSVSNRSALNGASELTISFDAKCADNTGYNAIIESYGVFSVFLTSAYQGGFRVRLGTTNNAFGIVFDQNSAYYGTGSFINWKVTYTSGELKVYKNGTQFGSTVTSVTGNLLSLSNDPIIGQEKFGPSQLTGSLDNIKIYTQVV